jgi:D-alanyl-D-alanine carboxypeptidase
MTRRKTYEPTRRATTRSFALAIATVLALAVAGTAPMAAAEATDPIDLEAELSDMVGLQSGGAVAMAVHDGETRSAAVGYADAAGHPMTVESGFRVGWFDMQFVAAMVLQLVDEGLVDLDAPLATYLPDVPLGGDATIRQLLTQQARLSNFLPELISRYSQDPAHLWTIDEIVAIAAEVAREEGTQVDQLGPTEYILLTQLVDVLDGDVSDAFDRRIVDQLGLQGTSYPGSRMPEGLAAGWLPGLPGLGLEGQPDIGGLDRISSFRTTAPDLARFLQALLAGEVVSNELLSEVFSDEVGPITLGAFFLPDDMAYPGRRVFGTRGSDYSGYSYDIVVDPETGDIAVVLANNADIDTHPVAASIVESWSTKDGS